ncbi:hypothetical protein ES703_99128 [subsurface metagenome]
MIEKQRDSFKSLAESIDKTEEEITHLLVSIHECYKAGKVTKKHLDHKRAFYKDILIRFTAMKEIIQSPRLPNFRLRRLREEHSLSQNDLAEKVGVSRQWIVHLEAGEITRTISKKVKLRVCKILGVSFKEAFPVDHLLEMLIKKEML